MERAEYKSRDMLRFLLLGSGLLFLLLSAVCSAFVYDLVAPLPEGLIVHEEYRLQKIDSSRIGFFIVSILFISGSELIRRAPKIGQLAEKPAAGNVAIALLTFSFLILVPEFLLRPMTLPVTTIFTGDDELGWKLKPDTEGDWGGTPVRINRKGTRGPELDYEKSPGVLRILFLGDSVTFGFGLQSYEEAFPHQVEALIENDNPELTIEAINAGVGGYSPWQENIFLSKEGIKYQPDLVMVAFVLNDVTEKMSLARFGGGSEGWQLLNTVSSRSEELFHKSAILSFARRLSGMIRYGRGVRVGAQEEEVLNAEYLANNPDKPEVEIAWKITLENLSKIYGFCRDREISVALVILPFTFQFEDIPNLGTPQKIVREHASTHRVPAIDLLPILAERLDVQGLGPEEYFLDPDHLSPAGSRVVSEVLVDFIEKQGLLEKSDERGENSLAKSN